MKTPLYILGITVLIALGFAMYAELAFGKQVAVDVVTPTDPKTLNAEVTNITAGTDISITEPFSDAEKETVKQGLGLTQGESDTLNAVLAGQTLQPNQVQDYISALNKQAKEKPLSSDELRLITGLDGKFKDARDSSRYLSRKKIKDI